MKRSILLFFLLTGCLSPASKQLAKRNSQGATAQTVASANEGGLFWDSGGEVVRGTITVNANTQTVVSLRGRAIDRYLKSANHAEQQYCLVLSFDDTNNSGIKKHLRFRAIPSAFNNLRAGTQEIGLRIDLPNQEENRLTCDGTARYLNSGGATLGNISSDSSPQEVGWRVDQVCTGCNGFPTSQQMELYHSPVRVAEKLEERMRIPSEVLNLGGIGLRIDLKSQSQTPQSSCSQSLCSARGYDCCLDGQCVNDGLVRPGVQTSHPQEYSQAMEAISENPRRFVNYPDIFFVCPSSPLGGSGPPSNNEDAPLTPEEEQGLRLENLRLDYLCIQKGRLSPPEYHAGECSDGVSDTRTLCSQASGHWTWYCRGDGVTDGTREAFLTVQKKIWRACGCRATPLPDDPADLGSLGCPDFQLEANRNESGEITSITCSATFQDSLVPGPLQDLNINVPSRSAPHRFFLSSNGEAVDNISSLPADATAEGDAFFYFDELGKTQPVSSAFSMNSVLGQFSVNLSSARPAVIVPVEMAQSYILHTQEGNYQPCPSCPSDNWSNQLSAHPPSQHGNGLRALGYTTDRTSYFQTPWSKGNFEDNIFGRACWVPPTMLPFSHQKQDNVQSQRLDRLQTQAALYINGYQRDWYGFNKGALIGSFDGVKWFAVGNGRWVFSTSKKLFLAINAPFADLAAPSNLIVSITTDVQGRDTVATHDHDPTLSVFDVKQNQGATCQAYHQCNVDADCVTKLGWEYVCANIGPWKTRWPLFNSQAQEQADEETDASFFKIIQGSFPEGSRKRCVYRGAGAPCKKDVSTVVRNKQKFFRCAPNFYCADLEDRNFNSRLVRTVEQTDTILFGQEADILGRPMNYIQAGEKLGDNIISNLRHNFSIHIDDDDLDDTGLCRPGKNLHPTDLETQHADNDPFSRTDYINQISSCNSQANGYVRTTTCPIFQTQTGKGDYITNELEDIERARQNMCGGEVVRQNGVSWEFVFEDIELDPLHNIGRVESPALTRDACFRRAGSVCHTDLDCAPNRLHFAQAISLDKSYFGDTIAEYNYWNEYLICSQGNPKPDPASEEYEDYDMGKNRCCRETGKNLTMYTQDDDDIIPDYPDPADMTDFDSTYFTYMFTRNNPRGFYSRYIVANPQERSGVELEAYPEKPRIEEDTVPKSYQWKTFGDTASSTCCGGGWIRMFADDTNDWTNTQRLKIEPSNFACLNYQNELHHVRLPETLDNNRYTREFNQLCLRPAEGGCIQTSFTGDANSFALTPPTNISSTIEELNTGLNSSLATEPLILTPGAPYLPLPYPNPTPINGNDADAPYSFFQSRTDYDAVSLYLPVYIGGAQNLRRPLKIQYYDKEGRPIGAARNLSITSCASVRSSNPTVLPNETYCLDTVNGVEIIHAKGNSNLPPPLDEWEYAGLVIQFNIAGTSSYCFDGNGVINDSACPNGGERAYSGGTWQIGDPGDPTIAIDERGTKPGNDLYYLTKLGRLELLGIPQIWYEPIYCNSNSHRLVEGIFNPNIQTRNAFEGRGTYDDFAFRYDSSINGQSLTELYGAPASTDITNPDGHIVFQDKVVLDQIFSGHNFKCCRNLGESVQSADQCCSGFAVEDEENKNICKLPQGANLNIYFNRFVSNDGGKLGEPSRELKDEDFIPETGEPRLSKKVDDKLAYLGELHCASNGIRRGAAFGHFDAQPNQGYFEGGGDKSKTKRYSIVDDIEDHDANSGGNGAKGFADFQAGYRWDHHIYCQ